MLSHFTRTHDPLSHTCRRITHSSLHVHARASVTTAGGRLRSRRHTHMRAVGPNLLNGARAVGRAISLWLIVDTPDMQVSASGRFGKQLLVPAPRACRQGMRVRAGWRGQTLLDSDSSALAVAAQIVRDGESRRYRLPFCHDDTPALHGWDINAHVKLRS